MMVVGYRCFILTVFIGSFCKCLLGTKYGPCARDTVVNTAAMSIVGARTAVTSVMAGRVEE